MNFIDDFRGEYRWLSNFEHARIFLYGRPYFNNEAAYQASKTLDQTERVPFETYNGRAAKNAGAKLILRPDWDMIRVPIMYHVNYEKFVTHDELRKRLLETGDAHLIEGNTWHDNFWGNCTCPRCSHIVGQNSLGRILMLLRDEFRGLQ